MFQREKHQLRDHFLKRAADNVSVDEKIPLSKVADDIGLTPPMMPGLLAELEREALIHRDADAWRLTARGWEQGRRLLRAHRLYESYLAEHTGLDPLKWHDEADRVEHRLAPEQVNQIASNLNRPRYDPHGDAIPTRALNMEELEGHLLSQVRKDGRYRIVHMEDEPRTPFEKNLRVGLSPGIVLDVEVMNNSHYLAKWAGLETRLDSSQSAGISVKEFHEHEGLPHGNLFHLPLDTKAHVHSISPAVHGLQRRRLLDLGFVPGSCVVKEGSAAFGGPMRFHVRGTSQALRSEVAEKIFIKEKTYGRSDS